MARIATALTPAEIGALSTWLSAQPVTAPPAAGDALAGPLPLACGSVSP
jgi:hypothetical protein